MRLILVLLAALASVVVATACGPAGPDAPKAAAPLDAPLLLSPEDLLTLQPTRQAQGPLITGAVQPERRADLRAEVAAVVVQVLKDNGETVKSGDLLMRLDDTAIRENLRSAEEAERAASQALAQADRTADRLKTLQAQGMISTQALEDAQVRRNAAQSDLVAARSRVAAARQQLQRTLVRAPFAGVVSERKASAGDTAQIGKELVKVIDPRSMRFDGLVSADQLSELAKGQPVRFRINGFTDREFSGRIDRIDAAVNTATRQVAVAVAFDDPAAAPRVAGLFAEGRVETGGADVLTLPENALVRTGEQTHVWRVQGAVLSKVAVKTGERDARTGDVPVLSGLAAGDRLLRNPGSGLRDGQAVELAPPAAGAPLAAASSAAK